MKPTNFLLFTGVIFLCTQVLPTTVNAQQPASIQEGPIIYWTNHYRHQNGRGPVRVNPLLTQIARQHAQQMALRERMAHSLDGTTVVHRAKSAGYIYQKIGENVAYNTGYANPAWKTFEDWMKSPSHWENILEPQFTEIGVGVYQSASGKYYTCQVLAVPMPIATPPQSPLFAQPRPPLYTPPSRLAPMPVYRSPQPVYPMTSLPRIEYPVPRSGRNVQLSSEFEMPPTDYYVHPFPQHYGGW